MKSRPVEHALYYDDELLEKLQLRWGDGLLSPGGAEELARMLRGVPVWGVPGSTSAVVSVVMMNCS